MVSKEIHDVLVARWEGFKRLARALPQHHILAVELIRTLKDETIAVFTVRQDGEPLRYVVTGDARGKVKIECQSSATTSDTRHLIEVTAAIDDGAADPAAVSLGRPPPTQPVTPGIVAIGEGLLGAAFDVGEFVDTSAE